VPSAKNENLAFGTAVHAAFENLLKVKATQTELPEISLFTSSFAKSMHQNRDSFTDKSFERMMVHGQDVLTGYYNNYQAELSALNTFDVEKNLNSVNFEFYKKSKEGTEKLISDLILKQVPVDYLLGCTLYHQLLYQDPLEATFSTGFPNSS
jgi:hypothetical protein